jgi:6-pyruvoyl-tetrahydropterin synthase
MISHLYLAFAALGKYFLLPLFSVINERFMPSQALFLRDFTVLDCALLDPELGLLGESLHVSAELTGDLDEKGFIFDFGPAKKTLKRVVDDEMDHRLVVPSECASIRRSGIRLEYGDGLAYESPAEALVVIEGAALTLEALSDYLAAACLRALPKNVSAVKIELRAEARFETEPNFRYTHGLRLHDGNCQRLFHGHRNPLEVWIDGRRSLRHEHWLSREWENVHFAHVDTVANLDELDLPLGRRLKDHPGIAEIEYSAPQGRFWGRLPTSRIVLMETEPSIENIARLGCELVRSQGVNGALRVVAYEGLNKGASYSDGR